MSLVVQPDHLALGEKQKLKKISSWRITDPPKSYIIILKPCDRMQRIDPSVHRNEAQRLVGTRSYHSVVAIDLSRVTTAHAAKRVA